MTRVVLSDKSGCAVGELSTDAEQLIFDAEAIARESRKTKRQSLADTFRESIQDAGFRVIESGFQKAMRAVDDVRAGKVIDEIAFAVESTPDGSRKSTGGKRRQRPTTNDRLPKMTKAKSSTGFRFFEDEQTYPDDSAAAWFERLVGIDYQKQSLLVELELLLRPDLVERWSVSHHGAVLPACEVMATRAPLVVLEGDVGCGKTVLAQTVGDALARKLGGHVHLLKINTQVRGTGMVGEMTDLVAQAFSEVEEKARRNGGEPVLLLIDEADSLASKRAEQHMHHEDKAGVNTLLQRIDRLRAQGLPIAVMLITNRPDALDSAVRRRAATSIKFNRPDAETRRELFKRNFPKLDLTGMKAKKLITATGGNGKGQVSFTASDITDRLIPEAIKHAYLNGIGVTIDGLLATAEGMEPTPPVEGT